MGTHPIFESDFDCLTEIEVESTEKTKNDSANTTRSCSRRLVCQTRGHSFTCSNDPQRSNGILQCSRKNVTISREYQTQVLRKSNNVEPRILARWDPTCIEYGLLSCPLQTSTKNVTIQW